MLKSEETEGEATQLVFVKEHRVLRWRFIVRKMAIIYFRHKNKFFVNFNVH